MSIARTQLKNKTAVTDEDIVNAAMRKAGYQNDFVKELKRMHTRLVKLLKEDTPEGLRISSDMEIYDSMMEVANALEQAVLFYEPVEEPTQAGAGEHPRHRLVKARILVSLLSITPVLSSRSGSRLSRCSSLSNSLIANQRSGIHSCLVATTL